MVSSCNFSMSSSVQLNYYRKPEATLARFGRSKSDCVQVVARGHLGLGDGFFATLGVESTNFMRANTLLVSRTSLGLGLSVGATARSKFQEVEDQEEDPFEKLFMQLERDLEAGGLSDDEDVTEDDLLEFENQLNAVLMEHDEEIEDDNNADLRNKEMSPEQFNFSNNQSLGREIMSEWDDDDDLTLDDTEDEDEEQRVVSLEPWQLKKMAAVAQMGRRRANIKVLCAEVGLNRADVLAWLKDPPPEMLMYCATMEAEEDLAQSPSIDLKSTTPLESLAQTNGTPVKERPDGGRDWHGQKRLKKVHIATFERVFRKTTRPTNSMVQNLVELTHVPRKRIVDWFEERRKEAKPGPKFDFVR